MDERRVVSFRTREECAFDVVALGEVMLRLDPRSRRIRTAHELEVHELSSQPLARARRGVGCSRIERAPVADGRRHSASRNDWSAVGWSKATGLISGGQPRELEILDRVGGGDGFAAGLLCGLLEGSSLRWALEYGTAHGALVMTTPGDTSGASLEDVCELASRRTSAFSR